MIELYHAATMRGSTGLNVSLQAIQYRLNAFLATALLSDERYAERRSDDIVVKTS